MERRILASAMAAVSLALCASGEMLPWRWFRLLCDFRSEESCEYAARMVGRAAATGVLNGVLLESVSDRQLGTCGSWDAAAQERLRAFAALCARSNIEIVPCVFSLGYGSVLSVHPDLAAGVPVRNLRWRRKGGKGVFVPSAEAVAGFAGLTGREFSFVADPSTSNVREFHFFDADPFRLYRCRYSAKTEGLNPDSRFQIIFYPAEPGATEHRAVHPGRKTEWYRAQFDFHSGEASRHRLALGVWTFKAGRADVKDLTIEEVPPTALLSRAGTPRFVRAAAGGTPLEEGRDYAISPAKNPWSKEGRRPVEITFPEGSRVPDGAEILVDGFAPAVIGWDQYPVCMADASLPGIFAAEAADVARMLNRPKKWLLSMDEIRAGGLCETCRKSGLDMPHLYLECVKSEMAAVRAAVPDAEILIWSDMMDPLHNSKKGKYFKCAGGFAGLRDIMPRDLVVGCWYRPDPEKSIKGFEEAGFKTFAATYYDSGSLDSSRRWLAAGRTVSGFKGLCYCTWASWAKQDFRFLEDFAKMLVE